MKSKESPDWEHLFHTTNAANSSAAATRDPSPFRGPQSQPGAGLSTPDLNQGMSQIDEAPYMEEQSMHMLYPWLVEDFSWQQNQQADIDPAAAAAITGMLHDAPAGAPQMDFSGRDEFMMQPVLGPMESFERQYRQP